MSSRYREDVYVRCPYYRKEAPIEIRCQGIIGTHTINIFANKLKKEEHKDDFCCGLYMSCPLYQSLLIDEEG